MTTDPARELAKQDADLVERARQLINECTNEHLEIYCQSAFEAKLAAALQRAADQARLEEAKWWHPHDSYHHQGCQGCAHVAALEAKLKEQP